MQEKNRVQWEKHKKWINKQNYIKQNLWMYKKDYLFSQPELKFYYAIKRVADNMRLLTFAKVRWADFMQVKCNDNELAKAAKYYTFPKHIDILLVNTKSIPILVIELDDSSHYDTDSEYYNEDKQERDEILEQICNQINLPLLRLKYDVLNYDDTEFKAFIKQQISSIVTVS